MTEQENRLRASFLALSILWEQILVDIGQVGVRQDRIRLQMPPIRQQHAARALSIDFDLLYGCVEGKLHTDLARQRKQGFDHLIHTAFGVPDAMRQFGVGHHREGGGRLERAQPHIHILEGKGRLQAWVVKVG